MRKAWWFTIGVGIVYLVIFIINSNTFIKSLKFLLSLLAKIVPIFFLVFILMAIVNFFIKPQKLKQFFEKKKKLKWVLTILLGILSTGPIYMWYPLLADLKEKGMGYGLMACFLYNRAIKIPLLPLMFLYFSWRYIVLLLLLMIIVSVFQGILVDKIMEVVK